MYLTHLNTNTSLDAIASSDDLAYLKQALTTALTTWSDANPARKFNIVIDGCDMLDDESFSWLPVDTPPCFNIVLTARSSSSVKSTLERLANSGHYNHSVRLHTIQVKINKWLPVYIESELVHLAQANSALFQSIII